ncbi:HAMP domain-containing sensor histidine kinase [Clostridium aceticum]|nr:HAMP domain-containing sensor histidine kinase [Clostridium aceticum]
MIGFLFIFCIGYAVMSFYLNKAVVDTNNSMIKRSLLSFQKELFLHVEQYFELEDISMDDTSFENHANDFAEKLSSKIEARVIAYSRKGDFLADTANANGIILNYEDLDNENKDIGYEDLRMATEDISSFVVVPVKDKYLVVYTSPILGIGERIGIVRCILDYSEVFSSSKDLLNMINTLVLIIFGTILLFMILLSKKISSPIEKLTKATKKIGEGEFDVKIDVDSNDEVGELAKSFVKMNKQIKQQIDIIAFDRDNLRKIEGFRKAFFDNITHEMKTPLTIISGYCQILIDQNFEDPQFLQKSVRKIKRESENMHKMVLQLLEASKEKSSTTIRDTEKINLSQVVDSACKDMKIKADKYQIFIKREIEENIVTIGNSAELRRVVINLLDNSIKYGDVHSNITVKLFTEGEDCHITIEDKGKGIPTDKLHKIFKRFYRINQSDFVETEGYGLGLDIVKEIIDKHHGEIKISSTEQMGTTVWIKIPQNVYKTETSV